MGVLNFLGGIVKPITDLIDNITTTDEERGKLKNDPSKRCRAGLTKIENPPCRRGR